MEGKLHSHSSLSSVTARGTDLTKITTCNDSPSALRVKRLNKACPALERLKSRKNLQLRPPG